MGQLTGHSTAGVGKDIIAYLQGVCSYFDVDIKVTSGFRGPQRQAIAMFSNWIRLKRGAVYKVRSLPLSDRKKLNDYYKIAKESDQVSKEERDKAKKDFLALAKKRVGSKSFHGKGRAVDVSRASVDDRSYAAITLYMKEVKEGRGDIYHFESRGTIPEVDDSIKAQWQKIGARKGPDVGDFPKTKYYPA